MEKGKAWLVRIAGFYWTGLFLFSMFMFFSDTTELQFLAAALSGLAPLLFFVILKLRPTPHADIEITFAGAFCFAMNLIVVGQIALNGRPQTYLPYLAAGALVLWLAYSYFGSKAVKTGGFQLTENLKRSISSGNKTAFVIVTGADDLTCKALINDLEKTNNAEISGRVVIVSNKVLSPQTETSNLTFVVDEKLTVPTRYSTKFPLSALGHPGYVPGLVIADSEGKVVFEKWWPDVRKRQDASFVHRLLA